MITFIGVPTTVRIKYEDSTIPHEDYKFVSFKRATEFAIEMDKCLKDCGVSAKINRRANLIASEN